MAYREPRPGFKIIYVSSYWHWGLRRRVYAREYGMKSFRLEVRESGPRRVPPDRSPKRSKGNSSKSVSRRRPSRRTARR